MYDAVAASCAAEGRCWTDPSFPPVQASLIGGADADEGMVFVTLAGTESRPTQRVRVPVVWRRPHDIADEDRAHAPDCTDAAPAMLCHRAAVASGGHGGAAAGRAALLRSASSGDDDSFAGFSPAALALLAEYAPDEPSCTSPYWTFRCGPYNCSDVQQGSLGTCWFVSALTVVAERRDIVNRLFRTRPLADALCVGGADGAGAAGPDVLSLPYSLAAVRAAEDRVTDAQSVPLNPRGVYQLRLCIDGLWRIVTVDDHIPVNSLTGATAFTAAFRRQLWVALLEKAASKLVGSYAGMVAGTVAEGLRMLTGAVTEQVFLRTNETTEQRRKRINLAYTRRREAAAAGRRYEPTDDLEKPWEYDYGRRPPAELVRRLWERILVYQRSGFPMGASCSSLTMEDLLDGAYPSVLFVLLVVARTPAAPAHVP